MAYPPGWGQMTTAQKAAYQAQQFRTRQGYNPVVPTTYSGGNNSIPEPTGPAKFGDDSPIGNTTYAGKAAANKTAQKAHTTNLQRFLVNHGYQIGIDGVMGPQTKAAAKYFRDNHVKDPNSGKTWSAAQKGTTGPTKGPGTTPTRTPAASATPTAPSIDINALLGLGDDSAANSLADSMTSAEFDPQINQAKRNLSNQRSNDADSLASIQNWFTNLVTQNKGFTDQDNAQLNSLLSGEDTSLQNILGTLDPSARAGVSESALANRGALAGIGQSEGNYDRNMGTALALRGRDELNTQQKSNTQSENDMLGTLNDLIAQRGQKLVTNQTTAREQLLKDKAERVNLAATVGMLPGQLQGQQLDLAGKALGLQGQTTANALGSVQLQQAAKNLAGGGFTATDRMTLADGLIGDLQKQVPVVADDGSKTGKYQHSLAGVQNRVRYVKQKLHLAGIDTSTAKGKAMAMAILRAGGGGSANPNPAWFN